MTVQVFARGGDGFVSLGLGSERDKSNIRDLVNRFTAYLRNLFATAYCYQKD